MLKVSRGQQVEIAFAENSVQNYLGELPQKLKSGLFSSINLIGCRTDSFKDR